MKIEIYSRLELQAHEFEGKFGVISVLDPPGVREVRLPVMKHVAEQYTDKNFCSGVLALEFVDMDDSALDFGIDESTLFQSSQALAISLFYHSMLLLGIDTLYVHCEAGIARSAAIVAALELYRGNFNTHDSIWYGLKHLPNTRVYKMVCKELGILLEDEQIQAMHRKALSLYVKANNVDDDEDWIHV